MHPGPSLMPCDTCARHVVVTARACPFCGHPRAPGDAHPSPETPRALPRALVAALGLSIAWSGCQSTHPTLAAPYGAPPPPQDAQPRVASSATWQITLPSPIALAARARTALEISATNPGERAIDPGRGRLRFRVNGQDSPLLDLAFSNGVEAPGWESLPPGATVREQRMVLESLMPAPGEYLVELLIDGQPVTGRRVTVVP